jgi:hypothetical protein
MTGSPGPTTDQQVMHEELFGNLEAILFEKEMRNYIQPFTPAMNYIFESYAIGKTKGQAQADSSLRDTENVPLSDDVQTYFEREVLHHLCDAWIDHEKTKVGYEILFNLHFYVFTPPRPLDVIDADLK